MLRGLSSAMNDAMTDASALLRARLGWTNFEAQSGFVVTAHDVPRNGAPSQVSCFLIRCRCHSILIGRTNVKVPSQPSSVRVAKGILSQVEVDKEARVAEVVGVCEAVEKLLEMVQSGIGCMLPLNTGLVMVLGYSLSMECTELYLSLADNLNPWHIKNKHHNFMRDSSQHQTTSCHSALKNRTDS